MYVNFLQNMLRICFCKHTVGLTSLRLRDGHHSFRIVVFFFAVDGVHLFAKCWRSVNRISYFVIIQCELEGRLVERIPHTPTLTFEFDLSKFDHLVSCDQGSDWRSLVTIGLLELAQDVVHKHICLYLYIYLHTDAGENITAHHLRWGR